MIAVKETSPGVFEPVSSRRALLSLDGTVKASLRVIMAPSWTDEERARFGIYLVEPATIPDGKVAVGEPQYEKRDGAVVQTLTLEDAPAPEPSIVVQGLKRLEMAEALITQLQARLEMAEALITQLQARLAALEAKS